MFCQWLALDVFCVCGSCVYCGHFLYSLRAPTPPLQFPGAQVGVESLLRLLVHGGPDVRQAPLPGVARLRLRVVRVIACADSAENRADKTWGEKSLTERAFLE